MAVLPQGTHFLSLKPTWPFISWLSFYMSGRKFVIMRWSVHGSVSSHEDLLVHPCNLSTEPSAWLVKAPNTCLLKEWMNEILYPSTHIQCLPHSSLKMNFFEPNWFHLGFGNLSICQIEREDIKNGGTFWFFSYNLMLRSYPKEMFQGSVGKEETATTQGMVVIDYGQMFPSPVLGYWHTFS